MKCIAVRVHIRAGALSNGETPSPVGGTCAENFLGALAGKCGNDLAGFPFMLRLWIGGEFVVAGRGDALGRLFPEMFANTTSNREGRGTGRATAGQHVPRGWQQVVITSCWSSGYGFSGCCTPSRMCYIDVRLADTLSLDL